MGVPRTLDELLVNLSGRVDRLERRRSGGGGAVLPPQIGNDALMLGTTDLNTVFASGWYVQNSNANATLARNYPIASRAGELEVTGNVAGYDFAMQRYTDYLGAHIYTRTHYNGTWKPWAEELPPRLQTTGEYTSNWNAVFAPGWYWSDGDTLNNPPEPGTWFYGGPQYHEGGNRATQFVYEVGGVYPTAPGLGWSRYFDGTSWGAWRRLMSPHINENRDQGSVYLDTADAPGGPPSTYIAVNDPAGSLPEAMWVRSNNVTLLRMPKTSQPMTLSDTGWLTSGVGFAAATDFTLNSYRVRQFGDGHVVGLISLTYTGATLTPDALGNIPDKAMFTLPSGWQNVITDGTGWPALGHRAGYYSLFLRVLASEYRIANISTGATIVSGHVLHVKIDHYAS